MRYNYTKEDINFLKIYYPIGDWDKIRERFPQLTETSIYRKMHRLGIKSKNLHRNTFDISKTRRKWSDNEKEIILKYYENMPIEEVMMLLPNRTKDSIKAFAKRYNLLSYNFKNNNIWKDDEINYIKNNWELLPDKIIADNLGRTFRAVKAKREELGFYRQDMTENSYPTLSKYLRGQNQKWKNDSMKNCYYKCVLTGSKDFEIHHLYGVSNIINDVLNKYEGYKDKEFSEYADYDLSFLLEKFLEEQSKYPFGECVDKKLHVLFHSMYGQYYNTPEQWYQFKNDYKNGKYDKYV